MKMSGPEKEVANTTEAVLYSNGTSCAGFWNGEGVFMPPREMHNNRLTIHFVYFFLKILVLNFFGMSIIL